MKLVSNWTVLHSLVEWLWLHDFAYLQIGLGKSLGLWFIDRLSQTKLFIKSAWFRKVPNIWWLHSRRIRLSSFDCLEEYVEKEICQYLAQCPAKSTTIYKLSQIETVNVTETIFVIKGASSCDTVKHLGTASKIDICCCDESHATIEYLSAVPQLLELTSSFHAYFEVAWLGKLASRFWRLELLSLEVISHEDFPVLIESFPLLKQLEIPSYSHYDVVVISDSVCEQFAANHSLLTNLTCPRWEMPSKSVEVLQRHCPQLKELKWSGFDYNKEKRSLDVKSTQYLSGFAPSSVARLILRREDNLHDVLIHFLPDHYSSLQYIASAELNDDIMQSLSGVCPRLQYVDVRGSPSVTAAGLWKFLIDEADSSQRDRKFVAESWINCYEAKVLLRCGARYVAFDHRFPDLAQLTEHLQQQLQRKSTELVVTMAVLSSDVTQGDVMLLLPFIREAEVLAESMQSQALQSAEGLCKTLHLKSSGRLSLSKSVLSSSLAEISLHGSHHSDADIECIIAAALPRLKLVNIVSMRQQYSEECMNRLRAAYPLSCDMRWYRAG